MRAAEDSRPLTFRRLDARGASRRLAGAAVPLAAVVLLVAAACSAPGAQHAGADAPFITASETIIGRASWDGRLAVLTSAPALVTIDPAARRTERVQVRGASRDVLELWGLGESGGKLYSISRFADLVRIDPDGRATVVTRLSRPFANLFDTEGGMAGQFAHDEAGRPLAWTVAADGALSPMNGPPRAPFSLSNAEAGVAHLLSCSTPPRVTCWLPGSAQPLSLTGDVLRAGPPLEGLTAAMATWVASGSAPQVIHDAIADEGRGLLVLHRGPGASDAQAVTLFDRDGRVSLTRAVPERLRMLVSISPTSVLAVGTSGMLVEVRL